MKVTFLIGAGCEGKDQFELPSGVDFKKQILAADGVKEFAGHFNKRDAFIFPSGKIIKSNSTNILYQTIVENGVDKFGFDNADKEVIECYCAYRRKDDDVTESHYEMFRKLFYDKIYSKLELNSNDEVIDGFLRHVSFCSFLDSYFNYLRKPVKYRSEVGRIVKIYFAAYKSIVEGLSAAAGSALPALTNGNPLEYRKTFAQWIEDVYEKIIGQTNIEDTYYGQITDLIKYIKEKNAGEREGHNEIAIVTCNYTEILERIIEGRMKKSGVRISHLHGKLELFESVTDKQIKHIEEFTEEDRIFPYILIQSGVKPIISPYQIKQFAAANDDFETSEYIVVLGYGLNSDDEHIINMLREQNSHDLRHPKIVYFIHADSKKKEKDYKKRENEISAILGGKNKIVVKPSMEFLDFIEELKLKL